MRYRGRFQYTGPERAERFKKRPNQLVITDQELELRYLTLVQSGLRGQVGRECLLAIPLETVGSIRAVRPDASDRASWRRRITVYLTDGSELYFNTWGATPRRDVRDLLQAIAKTDAVEIIDEEGTGSVEHVEGEGQTEHLSRSELKAQRDEERKRQEEMARQYKEWRKGKREARRASTIWHGTFAYAGGHPDFPKPDRSRVTVLTDRVETKLSSGRVIEIPGSEIAAVRHNQTVGGGGQSGAGLPVGGILLGGTIGDGPDQFVEIDITRSDRMFTVRFKAEGMTKQKDAFAFYAAACSIAGREPSGEVERT